MGKALRQEVPRRAHSVWSPADGRPDPVAVLRAQDEGRVAELVPIRYGRMLVSPFTFYRGSAAVMAGDLSGSPDIGVRVQACGDAHVQNFGVYATPERHLVFDVNDFDETLPGPWEWDLKRLVASIVLDCRDAGWGDGVGADMVRSTVARYQQVLDRLAGLTTLEAQFALLDEQRFFDEHDDRAVRRRARKGLAKSRKRTNMQAWRKWVTTVDGAPRFVDDPPVLTRLSPEAEDRFHELFNQYRETLRDDRRHLLEQFRFRDVAHKVVGVGSVGLRAYVLLLEGRGDPDPLVLQAKEATTSVLAPHVGPSAYRRHGERVVVGQRLMQAASDPFLGWAPFGDRDFYVRQLRDHKGPSDQAPKPGLAAIEAAVTGGTLARAHARSVDPALLRGYAGRSGRFGEAMVSFAVAYADQAEADHHRLQQAAARGVIPIEAGV